MAMQIVGRERRKLRIRRKISGTAERPRLTIFRSAKHIYGQVVDDGAGKTLAHFSTLSKDVKGPAGDATKTDAAKLVGQAIANLIDNAIKYGRPVEGAPALVDVAITRADDAVAISVADHGPGIPAADRERVLKRFVRLEASRSRPGTGLGLSLVAAVARLQGGRVLLEDNAPGLRIVLMLPVRAS